MAAMTTAQKRKVRNWMERKAKEEGYELRWLKGEVDAMAQALIDYLNSPAVKTEGSAAIDAASSVVLTNLEKKDLGVIVYAILGEQDDA